MIFPNCGDCADFIQLIHVCYRNGFPFCLTGLVSISVDQYHDGELGKSHAVPSAPN